MKKNNSCECHICGSANTIDIPLYGDLKTVTSDCKPTGHNCSLIICEQCGCLQKQIDDTWQSVVDSIYSRYEMYQQSGGSEPLVFSTGTHGKLRSETLVRMLSDNFCFPDNGNLLDIGCGNGSLLRAFHKEYRCWQMTETELSDTRRHEIESIEGVSQFYNCSPSDISGSYDIVSMIHVLEHLTDPIRFLLNVKSRINSNGLLLIECPDFTTNPFDLVIYDHCTHYSIESLTEILKYCGYDVILSSNQWVPKELTIVARLGTLKESHRISTPADSYHEAEKLIGDLIQMPSDFCSKAADYSSRCIFGSSISATWLASELDWRFDFFVDEDPARNGHSHCGKPIVAPDSVPPGSCVLVPLPNAIAESVAARCATRNVIYFTPSAFKYGSCR